MSTRSTAGVVIAALVLAGAATAVAEAPRTPPPPGAVIWYDLVSEDAAAAADFYAALFGWEMQEFEPGAWVAVHDGRPIAGISQIPDELPDANESTWLAGIAVPDIEAAVAAARRRGATIHEGPAEVAGFARYAVIEDPNGAPFMVVDPDTELGAPIGLGAWIWAELWTDDLDGAAAFYAAVVGYERRSVTSEGRSYDVFESGGQVRAGLVATPDERIAPAWAPYVAVRSLESVLELVRELGGTVLVPPSAEFGGDDVALIGDPGMGALFVYELAPGREESP